MLIAVQICPDCKNKFVPPLAAEVVKALMETLDV
jgi:hypothetical protein